MQLAKRYNGVAILWEHRYYGDSLPFPVNVRPTLVPYANNASDIDNDKENTTSEQWQFLTTDQALEDVVYFANRFTLPSARFDSSSTSGASDATTKNPLHPSNTPWVWLGGSYPGVRGALLRVRNPETIFAV